MFSMPEYADGLAPRYWATLHKRCISVGLYKVAHAASRSATTALEYYIFGPLDHALWFRRPNNVREIAAPVELVYPWEELYSNDDVRAIVNKHLSCLVASNSGQMYRVEDMESEASNRSWPAASPDLRARLMGILWDDGWDAREDLVESSFRVT